MIDIKIEAKIHNNRFHESGYVVEFTVRCNGEVRKYQAPIDSEMLANNSALGLMLDCAVKNLKDSFAEASKPMPSLEEMEESIREKLLPPEGLK